MRSNGLAKLYGELTPRERLAAMAAAGARGDHTEEERLAGSSPWVPVEVPSHQHFAGALRALADAHVRGQLDLTAQYFRALAWAQEDEGQLPAGRRRNADLAAGQRLDSTAQRYWRMAGVLAHLFLLRQRAFEAVLREQGIDPTDLRAAYYPFEILDDMGVEAPVMACSPEEFAGWQAPWDSGAHLEQRPATEDGIAQGMRDFLAEWLREDS